MTAHEEKLLATYGVYNMPRWLKNYIASQAKAHDLTVAQFLALAVSTYSDAKGLPKPREMERYP